MYTNNNQQQGQTGYGYTGQNTQGQSQGQRPQYMAHMEPYQGQGGDGGNKPPKKNRSIAGVVIACTLSAALIGGAVGGAAGIAVGSRMTPAPAQTIAQAEPTPPPPQPTGSNVQSNLSAQALTYAEIAEKVTPSVVGISIKGMQQQATMFGMMQQPVEGAGSGVIISEDGYIVTNAHVVDGATEIVVALASGDEYPAQVVGSDTDTDIAVLKIDANNLPALEMGSSDALKVGDVAVVVGNPLGRLQGSVSQGIISALNRELTIEGQTMSLIQTDAAVNEGNSGGALVNAQAQLVGVVNAKTSSVGVEGLGFAIPIDSVKSIITDLMEKGYVTGRPMIGFSPNDVTQQISRYYGLPMGVYVSSVTPFSAAEKAGLQVGDVITAINGEKVETTAELNAVKEQYNVGDTITLTVVRDGKQLDLDVVLQESIPSN